MLKSKRKKEKYNWSSVFNSEDSLTKWEYFVKKHSCENVHNPYYCKADLWLEDDYRNTPSWITNKLIPYIPYMTDDGLYICRNSAVFAHFEGLKYVCEHMPLLLSFNPSESDTCVGKYDLSKVGPDMDILPPKDINDLSYWAGTRSWMSKQTDSPIMWRFWPHTHDHGTILYALPTLRINSYTYPFNAYAPFVASYYFLVKEKDEDGLKKFMEDVEITRK